MMPLNTLVLCTGNSARSILLEAILNARGAGRVRAFSAGSHPAGRVHPEALATLARHGIAAPAARSKSWDEFAAPGAPEMDIVITVCDAAAGEACPLWPGRPLRAHWGVPDPAAAPPTDQPAAFERAFAVLDARARAFLALPVGDLSREALAEALAEIGNLPPGEPPRPAT